MIPPEGDFSMDGKRSGFLVRVPKFLYFEDCFRGRDGYKRMAPRIELPAAPEPGNMWNCSPLLKREQEYLLFRKYNYLKYRCLLAIVGNNGGDWRAIMENPTGMELRISRFSENLLVMAERFLSEAEGVRNTIVSSNVRLVAKPVYRQERGDTVRRDELVSDSCAHIMKAVERFDYRRGFRFSTYCVNVIQNNLRRDFLTDQNRIRRFGGEEDQNNPSIHIDSPDKRKYAHEFAHQAVLGLETRQRKIIEGLFGINREKVMLKDMALELGLSRNTIVNIRNRALAAMSLLPCDFPN